jgi:hypothetical protein
MNKHGSITHIEGKRELIKPFDLSLEMKKNYRKGNYQYLPRWHPYSVWCMGNCPCCNRDKIRQKKRKPTKKIDAIKYSYLTT